ncbi:MAG: HI0074 family nucleotidyltransferase substrate-binding subunit [Candidatus Babeliales bacterium]
MEKLVIVGSLLNKALVSLKQSFEVLEEAKRLNSEGLVLAAQDSIIQRFEYSYESFWKFLKKYMEETHNVLDINSPRSVFRMCIKLALCSEQEGEVLLRMIDDSNATSHRYDAQEALRALPNVGHYYALMAAVTERISKKCACTE